MEACKVEKPNPRMMAYEIREWIAYLARTHPEFTTEDMILMQPTMSRLRELGHEHLPKN